MTAAAHSGGPAVTLFGNRDELDQALGREFERRGCSTHLITVTMGWLRSTTHAVLRLGTSTGDQALRDLVTADATSAHVVAVCERNNDAQRTIDVEAAWNEHRGQHEGAVLWYDPDDDALDETARRIADQVFDPASA